MLISVSNRMIGEVRFDAVTSEDHSSELRITENPIESGAAIADHAVVQPKKITINGVMVDHDHASSPLEHLGFPAIRGVTDFLNNVPFPLPVVTQTAQTIARANRLLNQATYIKDQVGSAIASARAIAPWLPDFNLGGLLDSSTGDSRVQKCYADLLASQKSGQPIDIQTGIHRYTNMLIESISVTQAQDGSATFTISAREIFIVETTLSATSTANKGKGGKGSKSTTPAGKKKSGRAQTQSAPRSQRGNVQLQKTGGGSRGSEKEKSQLYKIFGG